MRRATGTTESTSITRGTAYRGWFSLFEAVFEDDVAVAIIIEYAGNPLGVVDEGIAIALECPDDIVSAALTLVHGVLKMPGEQGC